MPGGVAARWAGWSLRLGSSPGPMAGAEPLPITYPSTSYLATRVYIALGADLTADPNTWAWEDVTSYVRYRQQITVKTGRPDEASVVDAGEASLLLDNRDRRFSRHNPNSPYYGLLTKNTPIWMQVDPGSGFVTRCEMFITEWPSRSDMSGNDVTTPITCAGIIRRLNAGRVTESAMHRTIAAKSPLAYWRLEDVEGSTSAASAVTGGTPMEVDGTGGVDFGVTEDHPAGTLPLPDNFMGTGFNSTVTGGLVGQVPTTSTATVWQFECIMRRNVNADGGGANKQVIDWVCDAAASHYRFTLDWVGVFSGALDLNVSDVSGVFVASITSMPSGTGSLPLDTYHHVVVKAVQNGGNVDLTVYIDGVPAGTDSTAGTMGRVVTVTVAPRFHSGQGPASVGHIAVHTNANDLTGHYSAMLGYLAELAHVRLARLCAEEDVAFECLASTSDALGPQLPDTWFKLAREAEATDQGVLYEKRWGLAYQARSQRYNAAVLLAANFNRGHISREPAHADDDQLVRNEWTITRIGGASYTDRDAAHIAKNGLYDDELDLSLSADAAVPQQASWRVHVGTVEDERWPRLDADFASTGGRELIASWLALPFGARMTAANPPDMYTPTPIDVFIEGVEERWDPISWDGAVNTSPGSVYDVLVIADTNGNRGRIDASASTLATSATDVATTISVASPGALWRTGAVHFDIDVAGEQMTVTNVAGGSSPQTFTVIRSINGVTKTQLSTVAGVAVKVGLWRPSVIAL